LESPAIATKRAQTRRAEILTTRVKCRVDRDKIGKVWHGVISSP
jgi:hypothetical protein